MVLTIAVIAPIPIWQGRFSGRTAGVHVTTVTLTKSIQISTHVARVRSAMAFLEVFNGIRAWGKYTDAVCFGAAMGTHITTNDSWPAVQAKNAKGLKVATYGMSPLTEARISVDNSGVVMREGDIRENLICVVLGRSAPA